MKNIISLFFLILSSVLYSQTGPGDCPSGCFDDGPNGPECGQLGYFDGDGDGWGTGLKVCYYSYNAGDYARKGGDCNDNNGNIYPRRFYVDGDGDGYGDVNDSVGTLICQGSSNAPSGWSENRSDCDDGDATINISKNWYANVDGDNWGDPSTAIFDCIPPVGMVNPIDVGGDYDDTDPLITDVQPRDFYYDFDGDGYGITSNTRYQSFKPDGYALVAGDCDDDKDHINPETIWYFDSDGDGLGASSPQNKVQCGKPDGNYVLTNNDLCPDESGPQSNNGCFDASIPLMAGDHDRNWIWSVSYDADGNIKGNGISYFDGQGKTVQTQTKDIGTGRIWAGQTLYDASGRPALRTLSAPIGAPTEFNYKEDFVQNAGGDTYSKTDFETGDNDPAIVGTQSNTLGWYYSDQNDDNFEEGNSHQDITDRPYSRITYSDLMPDTPKRTLGGNKVDSDRDGDIDGDDVWIQGYTFSMKAGQELSEGASFGTSATQYDGYRITKTVSRDLRGIENVVFTDSDGKTLAAARSSNQGTGRPMSVTIGEQGYVDVHVPLNGNSITLNGNTVTIYDLITEEVKGSLDETGGFARVSVNDPEAYDPSSPATAVKVNYNVNYYDYSLNEYDRVGRLTASYQPLGSTKNAKPRTTYGYNTLGQLIHTKSPDEGEAWFRYREDGQIRYSRNSKQRDPNEDGNFDDAEFSYTDYDGFGRPVESGVVRNTGFDTIDPDDNATPSGIKSEQLFTTYDEILNTLACASPVCAAVALGGGQTHVAGNVSKTQSDESTTYYSYDAYGRVKWVVQQIAGLGVKTIDYSYDQLTGQVTYVHYQKNNDDERFVHRYTYDAKDQLDEVHTSTDGSAFALQAKYFYYENGSLRRTELSEGTGKQGMDYVYNLAGQLKGINHPSLTDTDDPGGDTNDLFGMQVDYHNNDYRRALSNIESTTYGTDQFNGNIKGIRWNNDRYENSPVSAYTYEYDRNNWMTDAFYGTYDATQTGNVPEHLPVDNETVEANQTKDYRASKSITFTDFHAKAGSEMSAKITPGGGFNELNDGDYDVTGLEYDANGNIKKLNRKKNTQNGVNAMDDLTYTYKTDPQNGPNQLLQVDDADGDVAGADDIGAQAANNYEYNTIGQLTKNNEENIEYLYNTSGLVAEVKKHGSTLVKFFYNDRGHRVKKENYQNHGHNLLFTEFYVRDISGQVMAIYYAHAGATATLREQPVYGSGRIGVFKKIGGDTQYELTDHLGNVRAVFTKSGGNAIAGGYTDYFPFGMSMPGRNIIGDYRYGFQGQYSEKDDETGLNAFELRMYDSRIGRWISPDPVGQFNSPYLAMGNNPISNTDPDGGCIGPDCPDVTTTGENDCRCSTYDIDTGNRTTHFTDISDVLGFVSTPTADWSNPYTSLQLLTNFASRPDNDGIVTNAEAAEWRKVGNGQSLLVDFSKLDFKSSRLSVQDFNNGSNQLVNFFKWFNIHSDNPNVIYRPAQDKVLSGVHGTLELILLDPNKGLVTIQQNGNGHFDTHDFAGWRKLIAGNGKDFGFIGFGTGQINLNPPPFPKTTPNFRPFGL